VCKCACLAYPHLPQLVRRSAIALKCVEPPQQKSTSGFLRFAQKQQQQQQPSRMNSWLDALRITLALHNTEDRPCLGADQDYHSASQSTTEQGYRVRCNSLSLETLHCSNQASHSAFRDALLLGTILILSQPTSTLHQPQRAFALNHVN